MVTMGRTGVKQAVCSPHITPILKKIRSSVPVLVKRSSTIHIEAIIGRRPCKWVFMIDLPSMAAGKDIANHGYVITTHVQRSVDCLNRVVVVVDDDDDGDDDDDDNDGGDDDDGDGDDDDDDGDNCYCHWW